MTDNEVNEQPDPAWGSEAQTLFKEILEGWILGPDGLATLRAGCDSLSRYYAAAAVIAKEGLTIKTGELVRKHPCTEIAKVSLAGFLSAMRQLNLEQDQEKPEIGRPTDFELFRKRGRV